MKVGKPQSKRVPVRLRHKIQKASTAKQKKQRKHAKNNPEWRSRLKKDPGVPNLFPYKNKMLAEIEEGRLKKKEELQRKQDVAKAQRQGTTVVSASQTAELENGEDVDDMLEERDDDDEDVEGDEDMEDDSNPMAALLASAQARANQHEPRNGDGNSDEDEAEEWDGLEENQSKTTASIKVVKALPKQALADPIKAVSALLDRMKQTTDGIQRLIDYYHLPPLVTSGSDETSSFLVQVARKRGRLGRGGIPNLHSAALTLLSDVNDARLVLPSAPAVTIKKNVAASGKQNVQIVSQMSEPFKIEGLWGEDGGANGVLIEEKMVVES